MIGGSFTLAAAQSGFNNKLIQSLRSSAPEIEPASVLATGATQIRTAFTASQVPNFVNAYMAGLRVVFAITAATFAILALMAVCSSWGRSESDDEGKSNDGE